MDPDVLVRGLTNGSIYALLAVSFNIMYRPTNVFNFAQGDLAMLGAMLMATLLAGGRLPWYVAGGVTVGAVAVLAVLEEGVAVAPTLRRSSRGATWVITTLAVSMILENLADRAFGPDPMSVAPPPPFTLGTFTLAGVRLSSYNVGLIGLTLVAVFAVERFYRTLAGRAVLAVAEDRDAALLRGIDPRRLSAWSFLIGGAFAAFTGIAAAPFLYASTLLGTGLLLKGFEVAALGGVGSNWGALAAGCIVGVSESLTATMLSPGLQDAVTFVLVLCLLLRWPRGLLGQREARVV